MTPEARLTRQIRDALERRGWLVVKHHADGYTGRGHPDLYGCTPTGQMFGLEVKMPGKKPTPLQYHEMRRWRRLGAAVGSTSSVRGANAFALVTETLAPTEVPQDDSGATITEEEVRCYE